MALSEAVDKKQQSAVMELLLTGAVNRLLARFVKSAGGEAGTDLRVSLGASGTVVRPLTRYLRFRSLCMCRKQSLPRARL